VEEGTAGVILSPGHAWIAPGNFHMTVKRAGVGSRLELNQDPPENSCRPAVDVLFRSVAQVYGENVLAVVMTGMGSDGVIGAQHIRKRGGEVIIQDEASAVVWGMPGLVYAAGQADAVYPLDQLGQEITRRVMHSRASRTGFTENHPAILERRGK
jgi:two-component system chemotaxis response regulator CheB